ncbi:hypothetical protein WN48_07397 [Eufriesea mexicana]|uniref:Uncharacterized protein n=1 Tax=Eufriesea mexicana TaxID=516756 RepID=A0A310SRB4_9HYME|nr:hypothetical protein WN48_07397 [Eufriesea mexicana]
MKTKTCIVNEKTNGNRYFYNRKEENVLKICIDNPCIGLQAFAWDDYATRESFHARSSITRINILLYLVGDLRVADVIVLGRWRKNGDEKIYSCGPLDKSPVPPTNLNGVIAADIIRLMANDPATRDTGSCEKLTEKISCGAEGRTHKPRERAADGAEGSKKGISITQNVERDNRGRKSVGLKVDQTTRNTRGCVATGMLHRRVSEARPSDGVELGEKVEGSQAFGG